MHLNELEDLYNVPEEIFNNLQPHQKLQLKQLWANKKNATMKNKKLDIYIAATYLNCKVRAKDGSTGDVLSKLSASDERNRVDFIISTYQLVLTPLYKLSDEHAQAIAKIAGVHEGIIRRCDHAVIVEGNNGKTGDMKRARTAKVYFRPSNPSVYTSVYEGKFEVIEYALPIFDYLRFLGYDCGYGEITSLIDAGIAIAAE